METSSISLKQKRNHINVPRKFINYLVEKLGLKEKYAGMALGEGAQLEASDTKSGLPENIELNVDQVLELFVDLFGSKQSPNFNNYFKDKLSDQSSDYDRVQSLDSDTMMLDESDVTPVSHIEKKTSDSSTGKKNYHRENSNDSSISIDTSKYHSNTNNNNISHHQTSTAHRSTHDNQNTNTSQGEKKGLMITSDFGEENEDNQNNTQLSPKSPNGASVLNDALVKLHQVEIYF